jgi:hypothetical protein
LREVVLSLTVSHKRAVHLHALAADLLLLLLNGDRREGIWQTTMVRNLAHDIKPQYIATAIKPQ